ncbi:endo-1,4-beta-xylanase [Cellulomonas sp. PhB150]|uniref:endo-1,4-beta-xylanase n=1 Tax=Cellulomonas sp. PhB150 TaxID=2485188 RepID=UPI000F4A9A4D|nr:endo-1,4-beta-xylanase [Cellulomonas sp. PhB150]ROS26006.1 GH35 family endo-1,4-beta-xylanase [Cellulomonas sp. PhB150]
MTYTHRQGSCEVTVLRADGTPAAGCPVTVEQVRHAFGFGNIGFDLIALANGEDRAPDGVFGGASAEHGAHLAELWLDLFDTATLPFYWAGFEPVRGEPDTLRLQRAARWFVERGVRVKGHPLVWHTLTPPWLSAVPDDEVEPVLRERVRREVGDFVGLVDQWDAINEVVILPVFTAEENAVTRLAQRLGRVEMVRLAFSSARSADPHARLVLNDFDLGPDYERLIEECLAAGIAIDAIGLQTHMHQGYRGEDAILAIVDRFARFGLPLQLTETTLLSGDLMPAHVVDLNDYQVPTWPSTPAGEARQADEVVRHYRSLVGHPAVESITYWGLTDEGAWLGAPAGLVRADGTPKPAYDALHGLVRGEWWTAPTSMRTDEAGRLVVRGFAGDYRVTLPGGPTAGLTLTAAGSTATLTL